MRRKELFYYVTRCVTVDCITVQCTGSGYGTLILYLPWNLQVWAKFGHPILRRSFRRVLCLYAYTSHFFFF